MLKMYASRDPKRLLLVCFMLLLCFLAVAYFRESFTTVNMEVNVWATSIHSGLFTPIAVDISIVFDTAVLAVMSIAIATIMYLRHQWKYSLLLMGAIAGDALLVAVCKTLIASPRPISKILIATDYSFPSGHVTGTIVFFGVLTYFAWNQWHSLKGKASTAGLYSLIVGVVGFDRVYLNVHWLSDVVGAAFLGSLWLTFSIAVFSYLSSRKARQLPFS